MCKVILLLVGRGLQSAVVPSDSAVDVEGDVGN